MNPLKNQSNFYDKIKNMTKIIAITNQKGGVGKTTTAYNLAASLAHYNKRVLLLDMDPQGNCSQALGIDPSLSKRTMAELFLEQCDLKHAIRKTAFSNISIISANLNLAMVETSLAMHGKSSFSILKEKLSDTKSTRLYDYIIIDCPPSLGFLSSNALTCADSIIIPMQCEIFSLDALAQLLSTIANIQQNNNPKLSILGILLTMVDPRTKYAMEIEKEVRNNFKDYVFTTVIHRNISIPEAIYKGVPVSHYKPNSAGALNYLSLAREVIERVSNEKKKE